MGSGIVSLGRQQKQSLWIFKKQVRHGVLEGLLLYMQKSYHIHTFLMPVKSHIEHCGRIKAQRKVTVSLAAPEQDGWPRNGLPAPSNGEGSVCSPNCGPEGQHQVLCSVPCGLRQHKQGQNLGNDARM